MYDIGHNLSQLIHLVGDLVHVDAAVVRHLLKVTIPASKKQNTIFLSLTFL